MSRAEILHRFVTKYGAFDRRHKLPSVKFTYSRMENMVVAFAKHHKVYIHLQEWPDKSVEITDLNAITPGNGGGTMTMQYLVRCADTRKVKLYLWPSSPRNVEFYSRFGFVKSDGWNGRMERNHK